MEIKTSAHELEKITNKQCRFFVDASKLSTDIDQGKFLELLSTRITFFVDLSR